VLQEIDTFPERSTRQLGRTLGVHHSVVGKILKVECRPYMKVLDYEPRAQYCNWLLNQNQQNPAFMRKILWTDEATFTRDGVFNYHNNHYWAVQTPTP
jgi:hypothetical protein